MQRLLQCRLWCTGWKGCNQLGVVGWREREANDIGSDRVSAAWGRQLHKGVVRENRDMRSLSLSLSLLEGMCPDKKMFAIGYVQSLQAHAKWKSAGKHEPNKSNSGDCNRPIKYSEYKNS